MQICRNDTHAELFYISIDIYDLSNNDYELIYSILCIHISLSVNHLAVYLPAVIFGLYF